MVNNIFSYFSAWVILLLVSVGPSYAQTEMDEKLAFKYYNDGDYEKAEIYFEKIYTQTTTFEIFEPYFTTLISQEKFKEAEKLSRKQLKLYPSNIITYVYIGQSLDHQGKKDKALDEYLLGISKITKSTSYNDINQLSNYFQKYGLIDLAIKTFQTANAAYGNPTLFNANIAVLYGAQGKTELMIDTFLDMLEHSEHYLSSVQRQITNAIDFETQPDKVELLKSNLLKRIQSNPNKTIYNEMLAWVFLSTGNYNGAFTQLKALDKKDNKNGDRVMSLGNTCMNNENYDVAVKCYDFIIELGSSSKNFNAAKAYRLKALKLKLTTGGRFTEEELVQLKNNYESTLNSLGWNMNSIATIQELAQLEAYYLNNAGRSIELLTRALEYPGLSNKIRAQLKVQLADVQVISGDIWEASLLYMQVEKDFKEEPLGHEAKFKAARIFYYTGNFEWAQAQLDVLKASTSKLIANDAMDLSMLISDNYNMDTTQVTMMMFARADLMIQQHLYKEALLTFDSINQQFSMHTLNDEILYKRAEISINQQQYQEAVAFLEEIALKYGDDLLADDALYQIAQIYEYRLEDTAKAAEYYKRIVFDYKGSLYGVEAREKFRKLGSTGNRTILENELKP
jgi:tetratricopeptide (TPR) repeat protein